MAKSRSNPAIVQLGPNKFGIAGTPKWFSTRARAEAALLKETPKGPRMKSRYAKATKPSRAVDAWLDAEPSTRARWNPMPDEPDDDDTEPHVKAEADWQTHMFMKEAQAWAEASEEDDFEEPDEDDWDEFAARENPVGLALPFAGLALVAGGWAAWRYQQRAALRSMLEADPLTALLPTDELAAQAITLTNFTTASAAFTQIMQGVGVAPAITSGMPAPVQQVVASATKLGKDFQSLFVKNQKSE